VGFLVCVSLVVWRPHKDHMETRSRLECVSWEDNRGCLEHRMMRWVRIGGKGILRCRDGTSRRNWPPHGYRGFHAAPDFPCQSRISRRKKISRLIDLAELTKRLKLTQFGCISWHEVHCTRKV
jgi:hypothetical protein